ncbi:MAG: OstA-like protein [Chitinophagales bacterium]
MSAILMSDWYNTYRVLLCLCFIGCGINVYAQKTDTTDKIRIHILNSKDIVYNKTDSGIFYKFIGDVEMQQGTDILYCDSLYQNVTTKILEAFSNVRIAQQDGTQATSDYLRYTSDKKLAFMKGNVTLMDGKNNLRCEELTYDLDTKTGVYDKGGALHNDSTTVTSNAGIYNVRDKEVHFTGHVVITDPQYNIKSEDLVYNTETKVTHFYAWSVVTSDSGRFVLETTRGDYDSKNVIAHFIKCSSIWNDGQYIEADSIMHYNKITGYGFADGHVISIDTQRHATLYCAHAEYLRKKGVLWATIKPVMEQVNGKDTLYMRADTFYSAPMIRKKIAVPGAAGTKISNGSIAANTITSGDSMAAKLPPDRKTFKADTLGNSPKDIKPNSTTGTNKEYKSIIVSNKTEEVAWIVPDYKYRMPDFQYDTAKTIAELYKKTKRKKGNEEMEHTIIPDTTSADTAAPLYFVGYHHVRIFSDSLQGKCDSVCYTRSDSTIRMINTPIVWAHNSQITGDTILLRLDSSQLRSMYVPNNAFLVSQSGPPLAKLFDQVQGKTLTAYFINNEITQMTVYPNAESIYYSKDDSGAYIGVNQSGSERMRIFFENQKIINIKFEQEVHQTVTPLDKADLPNTKLSRFKWLIDQRPKTKEELFQ